MSAYELVSILGRAFANGETSDLRKYLAADCEYVSDYARTQITGADEIIEHMNNVNANVTEDCAYTFSIIDLQNVLNSISVSDLDTVEGCHPCDKAILLNQYGDVHPVAVVSIMLDASNPEIIKSILLSRKKEWFNVTFFNEAADEPDSPDDLPGTVQPLTTHDRHVAELQHSFSGQHLRNREPKNNKLYIWREADKYFKSWLKDTGYSLLESQIFKDCIGYRCHRDNCLYTIYMYAYGQKKTAQLDGEYCSKLLSEQFSEDSTVLVVYLHVNKAISGQEISYTVKNYCDSDDREPELWRVTTAADKPILEFYPGKYMMDLTDQFMYAFNRESIDVYDCIITEKNAAFNAYDSTGIVMNDAFYYALRKLHRDYGDMKYGYVRYNDVVYSSVPYLEGYGFFSFSAYKQNHRIHDVQSFAFEGGERPVAEFIKTEEREPDNLYDFVPKLVSVDTFSPIQTERFTLKLHYDNGMCIKYILPIETEYEKDEVVSFDRHVFTDKIWKSAKLMESRPSRVRGYPVCGQCIGFKNEYTISSLLCYLNGETYSEPKREDIVIYDDGETRLTKEFSWAAQSVYVDGETGLMKTLLSGQAFNWYGRSTFAFPNDLKRCSITFDYIDNFKEGLARVYKAGYGYGYIDAKMKFVIPMQYDDAEDFNDGKARVNRGGTWFFIDKKGKETPIEQKNNNTNYQEVCEFSEGLCRVSTLKLRFMDLAYHSDYEDIAGTWGYINEAGLEVIAPQYIYANDFENGIAIVCKGKWTLDPKWDNECNTNRYWTDDELWGGIDKDGNEVIPFIFDEIKSTWDTDGIYLAHYGGWKEGKWGVINSRGEWLAEPIFEDLGYEYQDGLFTFYASDKWSDPPMGVYDIKQHKVIFEPQFEDVDFEEDGWLKVTVFDKYLGRSVEKLIDVNGNEKFHSIYSGIYTWKKPYEVYIRDDAGTRHGLIDEYGNIVLPCEYDVQWNGISVESRTIQFIENGKTGLRDFDGNILIEPKYHEIYGLDKPLITISVGDKDHHTLGLIKHDGTEVIPAIYKSITWIGEDAFVLSKDGTCEIVRIVVNK